MTNHYQHFFSLMVPTKISLILICLLGSLHISAQDLNLEWAIGMGGKNIDLSNVLATDRMGNVFVGGYYRDTADFDPTGNNALLMASTESDEAFLAKYDGRGAYQWAIRLAGSSASRASVLDIAVDSLGQVYVAGSFTDTVDFDPSGNTAELVAYTLSGNSSSNRCGFLAKYDADGNYLWAMSIGEPNDRAVTSNSAHGVAVDQSQNVWVVGTIQDSADFDPGPGQAMLYPTTTYAFAGAGQINMNAFIAKYDSEGNYVWAGCMHGGGFSSATDIEVDDLNNIYVAGYFSADTVDFDPGPGLAPVPWMGMSSNGHHDGFLAKYDSNGTYQWAKSIASYDVVGCNDVAVDPQGYSYLAGSFRNATVVFDSSTSLTNFGWTEIFLAKYDPDGQVVWAHSISGPAYDAPHGLALDAIGNLYVGGEFGGLGALYGTGPTDFDPGPDTFMLYPLFHNGFAGNGFIAKYDTGGIFLWAGSIEDSVQHTIVRDVATDGMGSVFAPGSFRSPAADMDPGTGTVNLFYNAPAPPFTHEDIFVLKFVCGDTSLVQLTETVCDSVYTLNGETYTASGTYIQHLANASRCDSMIVLDLTIDPMDPPVITVNGFMLGTTQSYVSYQWIKDGVPMPGETNSTLTVTENADYQVNVTNAEGCEGLSAIYAVNNVSIADIGVAAQIQVYPNPASDKVTIRCSVPVHADLISMEGRPIRHIDYAEAIDLKGLADGIYLLRITDKQGRVLKYDKIVKKQLQR